MKNTVKIVAAFVFLLFIMLTLVSCSTEPKVFTYNEISIELDTGFKKTEIKPLYVAYQSKKASVSVLREEIGDGEGKVKDMPLEEYIKTVCEKNEKELDCIKKDGEYNYIEYTGKVYFATYYYNSFVFKKEKYYYIITAYQKSAKNNDELHKNFVSWMDTLEISSDNTGN